MPAEFVTSGNSSEKAAGIVFGIVLPSLLLAMAFYLVIKHLTLVVSLAAHPLGLETAMGAADV